MNARLRSLLALAVVCLACVAQLVFVDGGGVAFAAAPTVEEQWTSEVTLDGATLEAKVNPQGADTSYRFEYGTTTAYGSSAPLPEGDAGSGSSGAIVTARARDLAAGVTYHYRIVASNGSEVADGPDVTFTTFAAASATGTLPDGRSYELVSPPNKNGGEIDEGVATGSVLVPLEAAEDGSAVTYASATGFESTPGEAKSSEVLSSYLSRRTSSGWATQNVTPPTGDEGHPNPFSFGLNTFEAMSPDLTSAFVVSNSPLLPDAPSGYVMPYLRENASGAYQPLMTGAPSHRPANNYSKGEGFEPLFAGATSDFSHILFSANDSLTPEAIDSGAEYKNLYESSDGRLRLVNILPDGSPLPSSARPEFAAGGSITHVISADGSRVFWTDGETGQLYVRIDGARTLPIPGGEFAGASVEGSKVLVDAGGTLSEYDLDTEALTTITPSEAEGVIGMSDDGSYVYFVSDGVPTSEAPGKCLEGLGSCNLYVWHEGAVRFIALLTGRDAEGFDKFAAFFPQTNFTEKLSERSSQVSPNGRFMAFESLNPLTGYDNTNAAGSANCREKFGLPLTAGPRCYEVFLYNAEAGTLACASCNPTGARPLGSSVLEGRLGGFLGSPLVQYGDGDTRFYQQRFLNDEGRLFFESEDALSPRDTNGTIDVYEYENGEAHLLSGGFGAEPSRFFDASASGDDAFFLTRDQLTLQDQDGGVDVYDARIGGPPNLVGPPPCSSSDACKPGPTPQPTLFGAPSSETFSGKGNVTSSEAAKVVKHKAAPKHRKHKVKRKRRSGTKKRGKVSKGKRSSARKGGKR